jgi:hypothetical protein
MNVGDFVRVKDDHAFHDIRGKKCNITSKPTTKSVYVQIEGHRWGSPHYLFGIDELEPWEEPKPKASKPIKVITIGFVTQVHWFFGMSKEEAITKWLEVEGENVLPRHVEVHEEIIENGHTVAYSGPY